VLKGLGEPDSVSSGRSRPLKAVDMRPAWPARGTRFAHPGSSHGFKPDRCAGGVQPAWPRGPPIELQGAVGLMEVGSGSPPAPAVSGCTQVCRGWDRSGLRL